jgi:hypothetical protein
MDIIQGTSTNRQDPNFVINQDPNSAPLANLETHFEKNPQFDEEQKKQRSLIDLEN